MPLKKTLKKLVNSKVQDYKYWFNRPLDDKEKDWTYGEDNWVKGYTLSKEHPHRKLILRILSGIQPFGYLLEIGCNAGPNLSLIRDQYPEKALFGIDASELALEEAKRNLPSSIELKQGNFESLPWGDKYFDILLSDAALLYVDPKKMKKVLSEIDRVTERHVLLVERYAKEDKVVGHVWGRNYTKLFEEIGFEPIVEEPITEDYWPSSKNWQKHGRLYLFRRV